MHNSGLLVAVAFSVLLSACDTKNANNRVVGQLASDRIELTSEVNEAIVAIEVSEGSNVSRGDVLLQQDNARATAQLAEASAALEQANARLAELTRGPRSEQISAARAILNGARKEVDFRKTEYSRIQELEDRKLASSDEMDRAKAALDAAAASLELRNAQLTELLAGTTVEELAQAEAAVKQAAARRELVRIGLERTTIAAPVDGMFDSRLFDVGERPQAGQIVAVMLDGRQPHARVYVPENLRVQVRPGMIVTVYIDGMADSLPGRVRWISSDAAFTPYFALTERDRGRLSYAAKIDIDYSGERLPDGVPVEVEFGVDTPRQ